MINKRPIESQRQQAMNAMEVRQHFEQFKRAMTEHQIEVVDIWNMDECGIRIGVGRGQ